MDKRRFRIAFSFAGEKREFVERVADLISEKFGKNQVLYDKYHEAELARHDTGIYLAKLYGEQADLIVPVLCKNYDEKRWTGWEWRHIYGLLTKSDGKRVMLSRFEHASVDGLSPAAGFVELDEKTPEAFARLILERLALNEDRARDFYVSGGSPGAVQSVEVLGKQSSPSRLVKTIVVIDLAHFTKSVYLFQSLRQPATRFSAEVESFFVQAFADLGLAVGQPLLQYVGDGAILHFDSPERGIKFAELIQQISKQYNHKQHEVEARRAFRVGIATGEIEGGELAADGLIATAARLEAACNSGHVFIDEATWKLLPDIIRANYQGPVVRKIGAGKNPLVCRGHERCIDEVAGDDLDKQSVWRIYRKPESVIDCIIWRLRHQMPAFKKNWGLLKVLDPDRAFGSANELIDWAVHATGIRKVLDRMRYFRPADRDEQHWAEELLLFFSCRSLNFSMIKPLEQADRQLDKNNAALVGWVSSTSAFVVAACMAGLTGLRVYLGPTAGALEINPKKFAPGTIDYKRAALEDLFRKLHGRDPEDGCKDDDLIGKIVVELEVLRDSEKTAAICFDVQGWV